MPETLRRLDLDQVLGRACPPGERANAGWLLPVPDADDDQVDRFVRGWYQSVSADSDQPVAVLGVLGLTEADLRAAFTPVRAVDGHPGAPAWAQATRDAFDGPWSAAGGVADPFAPFTALGRRELDGLLAGLFVPVDPSARDDLLRLLQRRLWQACSPTLLYEEQQRNGLPAFLRGDADESDPEAAARAAWERRLDTFPVLAYLTGTVYCNWRTFVTEVLTRLDDDVALLARSINGGASLPALTGVEGDTGDLHNGGRAVALLTFAGGQRVVYKPKDLRIAAGYMALVERLNAAGLALPLPTRPVVPRGDYAWEGFVPNRPCTDEAAVRRFYVRMGETIALLRFLEGRDFWLDNLIADGEHPHFIDLEMLLQPRPPLPGTLSPAEALAFATMEELPGRTSAISMPTPIAEGIASEELGALRGPGPFASPFRAPPTGRPPAGPGVSAEGYTLWDHPEHVPRVDGLTVDPAHYRDAVTEGYAAMEACLARSRDLLADPDGPLAALRSVPVRYIYRDTWSCLKLVQLSLQPRLLMDARHRELMLAQLFRPVADAPGRLDAEIAIVASEIESLRRLDVPFFQCLPDGRDVVTCAGDRIPGWFPEAAADRLSARLGTPDPERSRLETDSLLASLSIVWPEGRSAIVEPSARAGAEPAPSSLAVAEDIGQTILDQAFRTGGSAGWLGVAYHPPVDVHILEVLRPDLLTGTTGIAVSLAALTSVTGSPHWRSATMDAIEPTVRAARQYLAGAVPGGMAPPPGGVFGLGAWLSGLAWTGDLLGDDPLRRLADGLAGRLAGELNGPLGDDPVADRVGLLLAILAVRPAALEPATIDRLVEELVAAVGSVAAAPEPVYRRGRRRAALGALPDRTCTPALALSRLAPSASAGARGRAGVALTDWLASVGSPATFSPGNAGAWLEVAAPLLPGQRLSPAIGAWAGGLGGRGATPLDRLEVANVAARHGVATPRDLDPATIRRALVVGGVATGRWFPEDLVPDRFNLSAIWGLPAVLIALLAGEGQGPIPSPRSFATPGAPGANPGRPTGWG